MQYTERPWGSFTTVFSNDDTTVKILRVEPRSALSMQYHLAREEYWTLLRGTADVVINGEHLTMRAGERYHVPRRALHRIMNPSAVAPVEILEVAIGTFDEDDIVRVADMYGRD